MHPAGGRGEEVGNRALGLGRYVERTLQASPPPQFRVTKSAERVSGETGEG